MSLQDTDCVSDKCGTQVLNGVSTRICLVRRGQEGYVGQRGNVLETRCCVLLLPELGSGNGSQPGALLPAAASPAKALRDPELVMGRHVL